MELNTKRLILRPWREADAPELYRWASDPRVGPVAGWPPHTGVEMSREIIRTVFAPPEVYAVVPRRTGLPVGCIGLTIGAQSNLKLPEDEAELGYWLGVPFWGHGLIPEAAAELLRRGFQDLCLSRIWCGTFEGNTQSERVRDKCGFTHHHTSEHQLWELTGQVHTIHVSCLTRAAYLKQNRGGR